MTNIVIVGAGLAGAAAAGELRTLGHEGSITLIGAEPHPPYERPPLSKSYLTGSATVDSTLVHDPQWYADQAIDLRVGTPVSGLDLAGHRVRTESGDEIAFDRLLLATGSSPRRLSFADQAGVPTAYLRTIEDSDRIRATLRPGARIAIIGAGWIGLEVAAAARGTGADVVVLESAELPLLRVLGPQVAQIFADLHRGRGVDLRLGTNVTTSDLAEADLVVVGVGVIPDTSLALEAGLAVENGILVDATLRTSHPDVWAVGDVANHDHPVLGRRVRVEHWDTAIEQAKVAAHNLLGGQQRYERLPYFFTDQYDLGMEYVGHATPGPPATEVVIEGDPQACPWRAFWLDEGRVWAGIHVNDWGAIDEIRERVGRPLT